jgi:hypothetical protein
MLTPEVSNMMQLNARRCSSTLRAKRMTSLKAYRALAAELNMHPYRLLALRFSPEKAVNRS